jgi:hypothetical protein
MTFEVLSVGEFQASPPSLDSADGYSPASHHGGPDAIAGHSS